MRSRRHIAYSTRKKKNEQIKKRKELECVSTGKAMQATRHD